MRKVLFLILLFISIFWGCKTEDYPYYMKDDGEIDIDYLVLRYNWSTGNGQDLDTRTSIIAPQGTSLSAGAEIRPMGNIFLGGDNTGVGFESVLVNFKALNRDFPAIEVLTIQLRAFWYGSRGDGNYKIEFTAYKGGSMVLSDYNWKNVEGELVSKLEGVRNAFTNISSDIDGDDAGTVKYDLKEENLDILPP